MVALAVIFKALAKPSLVHTKAAASCPASSRIASSPSDPQARTISDFLHLQGARAIAMIMTMAACKSTAKVGTTLAQRLTSASMVLTSRF